MVEAVLEFPEFDAQVERSAGPVCAAALRNITGLVEAAMPAIEKQFGCPSNMNDGDFLFMVADSAVEGVQYGYRVTLCDYVVPHYLRLVEAASKAAVVQSSPLHLGAAGAVSEAVAVASVRSVEFDLLQAFVNYTNNVFFGEQGNSCDGYDRRHWMDTTRGNADRSWGWQSKQDLTHSRSNSVSHSTQPPAITARPKPTALAHVPACLCVLNDSMYGSRILAGSAGAGPVHPLTAHQPVVLPAAVQRGIRCDRASGCQRHQQLLRRCTARHIQHVLHQWCRRSAQGRHPSIHCPTYAIASPPAAHSQLLHCACVTVCLQIPGSGRVSGSHWRPLYRPW